jgi:hypothetical protein
MKIRLAATAVSLISIAAAARGARPSPMAEARATGNLPELFATSDNCVACHNNLKTRSGEDVSIAAAWSATMMANSARDPYWRASVRREMIDHPLRQAEIEAECATCHAPMAAIPARLANRHARVLDVESSLAADGVSCTVCHQIGAERLGDPSTFNGRFAIDTTTPWGSRRIFGAHEVDSGRARLMQSASEFIPARSEHVRSSAICASCHTLFTETLDSAGKAIGRFPEQVPFLEWRHSDYGKEARGRSCQACHMPPVPDSTTLSGVLGITRRGLARHEFLGGNFFMLDMLNRYRASLGVTAEPAELDRAVRRTLEHLGSATAAVSIEEGRVSAGRLTATVSLRNLTGHKLPTAYPARRAWLHVVVRDGAGTSIFESGKLEATGEISGNANDADPGAFESHYRLIERPDQVQIYESVLGDVAGRVTTGLLSAHRYLKDNRLLPDGFDKGSAGSEIAVVGDARDDPDFSGGVDRVQYAIPVSGRSGPFRIEVTLRFQPIGFRWARNLRHRGPGVEEVDRFVRYYDAMAQGSSAPLASASITLPE